MQELNSTDPQKTSYDLTDIKRYIGTLYRFRLDDFGDIERFCGEVPLPEQYYFVADAPDDGSEAFAAYLRVNDYDIRAMPHSVFLHEGHMAYEDSLDCHMPDACRAAVDLLRLHADDPDRARWSLMGFTIMVSHLNSDFFPHFVGSPLRERPGIHAELKSYVESHSVEDTARFVLDKALSVGYYLPMLTVQLDYEALTPPAHNLYYVRDDSAAWKAMDAYYRDRFQEVRREEGSGVRWMCHIDPYWPYKLTLHR